MHNELKKTTMQETKRMDLRQLDDLVNEPQGGNGTAEKENNPTDSATALQLLLDKIPIRWIPGIQNLSVLELNTADIVKDAIQVLYERNVSGAPIADVLGPEATIGRSSDRYIGFIDFASMFLWSLENCEKTGSPTAGCDGSGEETSTNNLLPMLEQNGEEAGSPTEGRERDVSGEETGRNSLLSMLEQNPQIGQTKLGELSKSFLLEPFLPVHLDDTLFHVLLMLAKHRLNIVPVMERPDYQIIGFATQNAVIQLLLQYDGLQWFDNIASRALSEFRFENEKHVDHVHGDESLEEALHIMSKSQIGAIAVIDRGTGRLIGCFRRSDVYHLMENDLFQNRKNITMNKFIQKKTVYLDSHPTTEGEDLGVLCLRNCYGTRMDSPVTNKRSDTLRQAMKNMVRNKSKCSFLIDNSRHALGILTLKDIIIQFAPPCIDSSIHGVGFFESALEEVGCRVKNGNVVSDH